MDYLWPCLLFVWAAYIWDTYLQWRQRRVYQSVAEVPVELTSLIDQKTFNKSRCYQLDKSSFTLTYNLFKQIEFLIIVAFGLIPLSWGLAGSVVEWLGLGPEYEITQSLVYVEILVLYSSAIGLPWSLYSTFSLEERHGFNKQTLSFFLKDMAKSIILQLAIIPFILAGLLYTIQAGGRAFYIYAWLFLAGVTMLWVTVYHDFIAPLFDKYTALPEGSLYSAIRQLASSLNFPLTNIQVVEGSKRSAHSNAYFYGFWKNKKIVLFDTLLAPGIMGEKEGGKAEVGGGREGGGGKEGGGGEVESSKQTAVEEEEDQARKEEGEESGGEGGSLSEESKEKGESSQEQKQDKKKSVQHIGCSESEVLAVLTHELGHWSYSHNLKLLAIQQVNFLLCLVMFGYFMEQQDVYFSFGFPSSRPVLIGLILIFELIFVPYNELMQFLIVQLIRRFEYQADSFAKQLKRGTALHSALTKLSTDNLSFPIADPLYSAFHLTHPTFLERIRLLGKED